MITISFTNTPHIVNAEIVTPQTEDTKEVNQTDINPSNEDSSDMEKHETNDEYNNLYNSVSDKHISPETEDTISLDKTNLSIGVNETVTMELSKTFDGEISYQIENVDNSINTPTVNNINDGWVTVDGELYYYKNGTLAVNSWVLDTDGWRYLDINGNILKETFISDSTGLCYLDDDGYWNRTAGWLYDKTVGKWSYIGSNGYALTNTFAKDSTGLCYLGDDGYWNSTAGWLYDKTVGKWSYIGSNGYAITNTFVTDSTGLCYLGNDGYWDSASGWRYNSAIKNWAYIGFEGYALKDAWKKDSSGWCYLSNQGYWDKNTADLPPLSEMTIMLDPGHGSKDTGAYYGGTAERDLNLSVSKKVAALLEKQGYNVVMTRYSTDNSYSSTSSKDLFARAAKANEIGADIYVSIHHNAAGKANTSVSGIETYYYGTNSKYPPLPGNANSHNDPTRINESSKLANLVHNELITATGAKNRGVGRGAYVVVREVKMPAILLELGYMSNPTELNLIKSNTYQNTLASAIVGGINHYFGT